MPGTQAGKMKKEASSSSPLTLPICRHACYYLFPPILSSFSLSLCRNRVKSVTCPYVRVLARLFVCPPKTCVLRRERERESAAVFIAEKKDRAGMSVTQDGRTQLAVEWKKGTGVLAVTIVKQKR